MQPTSRLIHAALLTALMLALPCTDVAARGWYVDPTKGDDVNPGTKDEPVRHLPVVLEHLEPGDTVYLREGVHLGQFHIDDLHAEEEAPITIRGYPDEDVVLDAAYPYFREPDNDHWQRVPEGAPDEWRSTMEVAPGTTVGLFLDSGIRLLQYSNPNDFRADNQLWAPRIGSHDPRPGPENTDSDGSRQHIRTAWTYFGPGLYWNPDTRRVHIRLTHTDLAHLVEPYHDGDGDPRRPTTERTIARQTEFADYTGPTDPRELALAISPSDRRTLSVTNSSHVHLRDLTVRGGGGRLAHFDGNEGVVFEDCVFYVGRYFARFGDSEDMRFAHCEFEGGMPPWSFRAEFKGPYYYITDDGEVRRNNQIRWTSRNLFGQTGATRGLEVAHSEFRNAHDVYFAGTDTRIHHNLIEDIHDDAMFISSRGIENMHIHHNVIRRSLMGMAFHGNREGVSRYVYRNIFDLREPTRGHRPTHEDERRWAWRALYIAKTGEIGPTSFYQNTFLVRNGFTIMGGLRFRTPDNPRRILNNLFISLNPHRTIAGTIPSDYPAEIDGNLWHRHGEKEATGTPLFRGHEDLEAYRDSELFEESKQWYEPGWKAHDIQAEPGFKRFHGEARPDDDLRLRDDSPARGAGIVLPDYLEDPDRLTDGKRPDIGALPHGTEPIAVGRHGRFQFPDPAVDQRPSQQHVTREASRADPPTLAWAEDVDGTWSDPERWEGGEAPVSVERRRIDLNAGTSLTVTLDRDQQLRGGVEMSGFRGSMDFDLAGYRLTVAGDLWRLGGNRNDPVFRNGTVQFGDEARPLTLRVYLDRGDDNRVTFKQDTTIDAVNLETLTVGEASGNRVPTGTLDWREARVTGDALRVGTVELGTYAGGSSGRGGDGTMHLPASLDRFEVDHLVLGHNTRYRRGGNPSHARGALGLSEAGRLRVAIGQRLFMAVGDNTEASWTHLPAHLELTIGDEGRPALVRLAHNDRAQGDAEPAHNRAAAELIAGAGELDATLTELRVAHNPAQAGGAEAVLDLSRMQRVDIDVVGEPVSETYYTRGMTPVPRYGRIEALLDAPVLAPGVFVVGLGHNAEATVRLPRGTVSAHSVLIGDESEGSEARLELHGTQMTVRDRLSIGPQGVLRVELDETTADENERWVVRIAGDHESTLNEMVDDGRIVVAMNEDDAERIDVFQREGYTWLGVP